jgi:hypothetical protein
MKKILYGTIMLCLLTMNPAWAADAPVGRVKTQAGEASIIRQGQTVPAKPGASLFEGDQVQTGADGSLGFIFKDNTIMTLGPSSEMVITEFLFVPAEEELSMVVRMLKGTATFLTGMIGKLSPEAVRIETPEATIGIRGTRFGVQVG